MRYRVRRRNSVLYSLRCGSKRSGKYSSDTSIFHACITTSYQQKSSKNDFSFGIYGIVIWTKIVGEINIVASRYDGKRTCPYFATMYLTVLTYGIFAFVWQHKFSERVGAEVKRRGYNYNFGASDFWLWCVLGSLIIVGPFVYCHKLMKSMNMINASYNIYG